MFPCKELFLCTKFMFPIYSSLEQNQQSCFAGTGIKVWKDTEFDLKVFV